LNGLRRLCLLALDGLQAATIKVKQLIHMLLGLGRGGAAEAGRGRGRPAHASRDGNKLEQIKRDIFIAAGA
jgi:hypothetical protein